MSKSEHTRKQTGYSHICCSHKGGWIIKMWVTIMVRGSHHQSHTMTAYWQECSSCENYVRPHSAAMCSGYFKAFAPRDINNIYLGKTAPTQTFHIWFFKRKTSNRLTNISQSFIVFLDFITVWDWLKWALSNYINVKYGLLKMILK